ncbi:MAG: MFS transporter [Anaerolineae bacterium]|nr:MFS transporter [Anaerolineae bacterium]
MQDNWKRTLYIVVFVQFVSAVGMSSVFPFLPLYIEELGTTTNLSVELLAGLVFSAQAFTMIFASPFWGALADRHGRKLMVERATFGGAIIIGAMGFVGSAEQLVLLRALQGFVTGVVAANSALVAAAVPRNQMGYAMGLLQVGLWGGVSVGPLIGGVVADMFGFREAFFVTALLLVIAGLLMWRGVEEHFEPVPRPAGRQGGFLSGWRQTITLRGIAQVYTVRFVAWLGRTMPQPFLSLFVELLLPKSERVATVTGLIVGVASFAGAVSAIYLGRLADRIGPRIVLIWASAVAGVGYAAQGLAGSVWIIVLLQALAGIAVGGIMPTLSALLARYTPPGKEGAVYGLDNSIFSTGRTIAPLVGSTLAVWFGLRSIFVIAGLIYLAGGLMAVYLLPKSNEVPAV